FTYVSDVVEAIILSMQSEKASGSLLNVGTGKPHTINQLAGVFADINDKNTQRQFKDSRVGDIRISYADITRASESIGYSPWVALKAAFGIALRTRVKVIVSFDGDGQHDPHAIPRLVEPVLTGRADITVGSRSTKNWYDRDEHRKFGIRALNLLMWGLTGHRFTDCTSGLTAMNANIVVQVLPRLVEPQFGRLEFWLESCKLGARIIE